MTEPKSEEQREKDKRELAFAYAALRLSDSMWREHSGVIVIYGLLGMTFIFGDRGELPINLYLTIVALHLIGAFIGLREAQFLYKHFKVEKEVYYKKAIKALRLNNDILTIAASHFWEVDDFDSKILESYKKKTLITEIAAIVIGITIILFAALLHALWVSTQHFLYQLFLYFISIFVGLHLARFPRYIARFYSWRKKFIDHGMRDYGIDAEPYFYNVETKVEVAHLQYLADEEENIEAKKILQKKTPEEQRAKDKRELAFGYAANRLLGEFGTGVVAIFFIHFFMGMAFLAGIYAEYIETAYLAFLGVFVYGAVLGVLDSRFLHVNYKTEEKYYYRNAIIAMRKRKYLLSRQMYVDVFSTEKKSKQKKYHDALIFFISLGAFIAILSQINPFFSTKNQSFSFVGLALGSALLIALSLLPTVIAQFTKNIFRYIALRRKMLKKSVHDFGVDASPYYESLVMPAKLTRFEYLIDDKDVDNPTNELRLFSI